MRRLTLLFLLFSPFFFFSLSWPVLACEDNQCSQEAAGQIVWQKLQDKKTTCQSLNDQDFHNVGDYSMSLMMGDSHEQMDQVIEKTLGKDLAEQMHVVMGKRFTNCEPNAQFPAAVMALMSMMWQGEGGGNKMMTPGWNNWNSMMGWGGFGIVGLLMTIIFWVVVIWAVVTFIRWITGGGQAKQKGGPLDILKERYAKGEIDKKEFEEKRKDLT